jgi:hypothetical protein
MEAALGEAEAARAAAQASLAALEAAMRQELRAVSGQRDAALSQLSGAQAKAAELEQANATLLADRQVRGRTLPHIYGSYIIEHGLLLLAHHAFSSHNECDGLGLLEAPSW